MCGKIMNAIVKHERLRKSKRAIDSMTKTVSIANAVANALTSCRYGSPDSKTPLKNP